ncbi:MAG: PIN domain-containing protein [Bacteroidetes bacterium]|nr:PIN domain-containing protein [Bacteroidota bacterium]
MEHVFADTDIILDLLARREPFFEPAAALFSLADQKRITLHVSSLSFANLNYLLSRQYTATKARKILMQFKTLATVLPVNDKVVELALASDFKDFEDALQYYTALQQGVPTILTRNLKDYKHAEAMVMTAAQYLKSSDACHGELRRTMSSVEP